MKTETTPNQNENLSLPVPLEFDERLFVELLTKEMFEGNEKVLPAVGETLFAPEDVCNSVDEALKNLIYKILRVPKQAQGVGESWLFALLRFDESRNLTTNALLKDSIAEAIRLNESGFFVRLGTALSEKTVSIETAIKSYSVELRLITSWISRDPEAKGLCNLSDEQISVYLEKVSPTAGKLEADSVRKKWTRLGLKKSRLSKKGRIVAGPTDPVILKRETGMYKSEPLRKR